MSVRALVAALVTIASLPAISQGTPLPAATLEQGKALLLQGKYVEARAEFLGVFNQDPSKGEPLAWLAKSFLESAHSVGSDQILAMRVEARKAAESAIRRDNANALAREILLKIEGISTQIPDRPPCEIARPERELGERCFSEQKFSEAIKHYEASYQKDPKHSLSILYAGDCYFIQKEYLNAIPRFELALKANPFEMRARRFLIDALTLTNQNDRIAAIACEGLALDPGCFVLWDEWDAAERKIGKSLEYFSFAPKASLVPDPKGGSQIQLDISDEPNEKESALLWHAYGMGLMGIPHHNLGKIFEEVMAKIQVKAGGKKEVSWGPSDLPPMFREMIAIKNLGSFLLDADKKENGLSVPSGQIFSKIAHWYRDGIDEAAVVLLLWREEFRDEFNQWNKSHPGALLSFLAKQRIRPY